MDPCQARTSVLCLHYRPETVHCSTKDAYTSEITIFALLYFAHVQEIYRPGTAISDASNRCTAVGGDQNKEFRGNASFVRGEYENSELS